MTAEFLESPVATNDLLFDEPGRRILQNVVTCVHEGRTINSADFKLERQADHYPKAPTEFAHLFRLALLAR